MQNFKKFILIALIVIVLSSLLIFLFGQPTAFSLKLGEFKTGNYSTVVLGHSFSTFGIDPHVYGDGTEMFNMANPSFPFEDIPYLLKELDKHSEINRVYLETYFPFWKDSLYSDFDNSRNINLKDWSIIPEHENEDLSRETRSSLICDGIRDNPIELRHSWCY